MILRCQGPATTPCGMKNVAMLLGHMIVCSFELAARGTSYHTWQKSRSYGKIPRTVSFVNHKNFLITAKLAFNVIFTRLSGEMMMSLFWYYRPEHTEQGRQENDASDEVFASRHKDHNSVACIEDKCYVLTYNEYCRSVKH